ncbi:CYTH domain-containing protein [Microbacterium sp. T2.11-28]|uniref:CYTH domain-containing protein n=1 Tax=Microbacterium sp. T2.11-28 TaxID=3041169 RepID=UPI0024777261|nr:CYTH domain-containing protein [Microbacterium sp. T2.11-28]CAI9392080.1 putative protein [Microbacterium sp. T2.11-28]
MTADGAERSIEIERKYDADDAVSLPDWTRLPGVVTIGDAEARSLDARYLDTGDGALGRAAIALRRRVGGPDEGWHIKRATAEGKHEARWPLDAVDDDVIVPPAVAAALASDPALSGIDIGAVSVIARIRNERTAYALRDADGMLVAEFVDDRVVAMDLRRGIETRWREWELELGPAAPADPAAQQELFAAADALVAAAGGSPSASGSKLGRALGV